MSRQTIRKRSIRMRMRLYLASLPNPEYSSNKEELMHRSWCRSTVEYLIKAVDESDTDPPLIISEFIKKADRRSGLIFRVAYETAVDLYDHLFL